MKLPIKYIHGSEDSTDIDVVYVFDELSSFNDCKEFCNADKTENRNIITIENGIVTNCFKGTVDEVNNALYTTYSLHKQFFPLLIKRKVHRNKLIKYIRAVRIILSHLSRSQYRIRIKNALRGGWEDRLNTLYSVDLMLVDFNSLKGYHNQIYSKR